MRSIDWVLDFGDGRSKTIRTNQEFGMVSDFRESECQLGVSVNLSDERQPEQETLCSHLSHLLDGTKSKMIRAMGTF